jgi:hypothetical protein
MKLSLVSSSPLLLALLSSLALVACTGETGDDAESGSDAVVESEGKPVMSADPNRLIDIPFYFSVPKSAVADSVPLNRKGYTYPTLWNSSTELENAGLRIIAINQKLPKAQLLPPPSSAPEVIAAAKRPLALANRLAKKAARDDMSKQLAAAGVIQDGDIVLSFRPDNAASVPYMHVQMGTTHASLAYVQNGIAKNVDSPMKDNEYVGSFNTHHFTGGISEVTGSADLGTDALHILRPRALSESPARRKRLNAWAARTATNRANGHVAFNSEYLAPSAPTKAESRKLATDLGKHILGIAAPELKIFCSEFAWHMLALSNCSEADIRNAGPDGAQCAEDGIIFDQMPLIGGEATLGLGEGPLAGILGAPQAQRADLITQLFKAMDAASMSSGHKATAAATAGLMPPLSMSYSVRAGLPIDVPAAQIEGGIKQVNGAVKANYSPTAFIAQATRAKGVRPMDYVATVVFVDNDAAFAKAKLLAKQPTP